MDNSCVADATLTNIEWFPPQFARPSTRRLSDADQWLEQVSSKLNLANASASTSSDSRQAFVLQQQSQRSRSRSVDTGEFLMMDRAYKMSMFSESRAAQSHNDDYYGTAADPFDVSWVKRTVSSSKPSASVGFCQAGDF